MINNLCPSCNAPAKNIGGSYTKCEYCGTTWVINNDEKDKLKAFDEKEYIKIKKRADEAFTRFKFKKAEELYEKLTLMIRDDYLSTGGGSNKKQELSFFRVVNFDAKQQASMINRIIEDGYGESSSYLDQIKEDYASSSEDNISFRGDNLDDILIERIEEIEDIVENYNDPRGLIVFIYELFNSFYGYSKQAIVDSSDVIVNNYSAISFEKYNSYGDTYYDNYINNSLLDRDLEKKCYFFKFTLKILNLYYEQILKLDEEFHTNFKAEGDPEEFGGLEKDYDFNPILLELFTQPLQQCSKEINVSLGFFNNPTFNPEERGLRSYKELIDEYNIFKNNFENFISIEDVEFSQLSNQNSDEDIDSTANTIITIVVLVCILLAIVVVFSSL